jgi:hypothetical protein
MLRRRNTTPQNDYFQLSANGGVPRDRVLDALKNPRFVANAVKIRKCFQCYADDIDVTGLCLICRSFLTDEERSAAQSYYDAP